MFEEGLRERLLAAPAVLALVGQAAGGHRAIAWDVLPQGWPRPAVVLQTISDVRPETGDGADGFRPTRVRATCQAHGKRAAATLREAVIAALTPAGSAGGTTFLKSFVDLVRSSAEATDTETIHLEQVDFIIWHDG